METANPLSVEVPSGDEGLPSAASPVGQWHGAFRRVAAGSKAFSQDLRARREAARLDMASPTAGTESSSHARGAVDLIDGVPAIVYVAAEGSVRELRRMLSELPSSPKMSVRLLKVSHRRGCRSKLRMSSNRRLKGQNHESKCHCSQWSM